MKHKFSLFWFSVGTFIFFASMSTVSAQMLPQQSPGGNATTPTPTASATVNTTDGTRATAIPTSAEVTAAQRLLNTAPTTQTVDTRVDTTKATNPCASGATTVTVRTESTSTGVVGFFKRLFGIGTKTTQVNCNTDIFAISYKMAIDRIAYR